MDKRKIGLREPLRELGLHKVAVRLASELAPEIIVNILREDISSGGAATAVAPAEVEQTEAELVEADDSQSVN